MKLVVESQACHVVKHVRCVFRGGSHGGSGGASPWLDVWGASLAANFEALAEWRSCSKTHSALAPDVVQQCAPAVWQLILE